MRYEKNIPPPPKPEVSDMVRNMPKKTSLFIAETVADPASVRTIVSRIAAKSTNGHRFQTARQAGGVRVWRVD